MQHAGVCSIQTFWYITKSSFYEPVFPCFAHRAEVLELKINPKEPVTTLSNGKSNFALRNLHSFGFVG
jgi:hypothetical protein